MESKKCPKPTNLNKKSEFRAKFDSNFWDSGTFLTPNVRGPTEWKFYTHLCHSEHLRPPLPNSSSYAVRTKHISKKLDFEKSSSIDERDKIRISLEINDK